eukprot:8150258-Alexandrium_andersonii.AAC.1
MSCLGSMRMLLKGEVSVLAIHAGPFLGYLKSIGKPQFRDAVRFLAEAKAETITAMAPSGLKFEHVVLQPNDLLYTPPGFI